MLLLPVVLVLLGFLLLLLSFFVKEMDFEGKPISTIDEEDGRRL